MRSRGTNALSPTAIGATLDFRVTLLEYEAKTGAAVHDEELHKEDSTKRKFQQQMAPSE